MKFETKTETKICIPYLKGKGETKIPNKNGDIFFSNKGYIFLFQFLLTVLLKVFIREFDFLFIYI